MKQALSRLKMILPSKKDRKTAPKSTYLCGYDDIKRILINGFVRGFMG